MKKFSVIFFVCFYHSLSAQLYQATKSYLSLYVDISKDSARVEGFNFVRYWTNKVADEKLSAASGKGDTIFSGRQTKILKSKNTYFLLRKTPQSEKYTKNQLVVCNFDNRESLRKQAYLHSKNMQLYFLSDSLSGPTTKLTGYSLERFPESRDTSVSFIDYKFYLDKKSDSVTKLILGSVTSEVKEFYIKISSVSSMDSIEIITLLQKAKYNFYYERYFLNKVAITRPSLLINYINSNPTNKNAALKAIRYHRGSSEMIRKVKETGPECKGKREIVKQKTVLNLSNFGAGVLYTIVVLGELTLITLFIVWLARL